VKEEKTMLMNFRGNGSNIPFFLRLVEFIKRVIPQSIKNNISSIPFFKTLINKQFVLSAPSGLTEVVVQKGILEGFRLKLNLKSESHYWLGSYEDQLVQAINDFCTPGMIVYDIGANIGCISLAFARKIGNQGKVFAFEPLPKNTQRIKEHIAINLMQDTIRLIPYAVSDNNGKEEFLVYKKHILGKLASSLFRNYNYINKIKVKSIFLDHFVYNDKNPVPDLIKIDIEGGGIKAIPGMSRILFEAQPILFMELHGPEEQAVAWESLKKNKYEMHKMEKLYSRIIKPEILDFKSREHIIAVPRNKK
jgi:FkbM family methyltransferase